MPRIMIIIKIPLICIGGADGDIYQPDGDCISYLYNAE